jgi:uncharacterized membrane protein YccF (DUF307 family)
VTEQTPPRPPGPAYVPPPAPIVVEQKSGPGLLVRALWFVFVGWWLSGIVASIAWFAMITIIGLPLGIWLVNRLPTVITLRPRTSYAYATVDNAGTWVYSRAAAIPQLPWWVRGIWFLLVGWWASFFVMAVAWALLLPIITIPIGLWLFNRVPFVASLYRY